MRGFDSRFTVEQLYQNLLASLDVTQPATLRQLALLFAGVGLLVLWDRLRRTVEGWMDEDVDVDDPTLAFHIFVAAPFFLAIVILMRR